MEKVTIANINEVIKKINESIENYEHEPVSVFSRTISVLNKKKYKGYGRPKNSDYKTIDSIKTLKKSGYNIEKLKLK